MKVKCICIDDTFKPEEIPNSHWVKKDHEYHITHVYFHPHQQISGVELAELDLSNFFPYQTYRITRFAFDKENFLKLIELIKHCSQLNEIEVKHLLQDVEQVNN